MQIEIFQSRPWAHDLIMQAKFLAFGGVSVEKNRFWSDLASKDLLTLLSGYIWLAAL